MTPETFNEELDISAACGDYLRGKYGAHRGHPEWRAMDEAFHAGVRWQAEREQTVQEPVAHAVIEPLKPDEYFSKVKVNWVGTPIPGPLYSTPPDTTALLQQSLDAMVQARLWVRHEMLDAAIDATRKHLRGA